jgi:hypothetical protein
VLRRPGCGARRLAAVRSRGAPRSRDRQRQPEQGPLAAVASDGPDVIELYLRLDPLDGDAQPERLGEPDNSADHGRLVVWRLDRGGEEPVDLDGCERELLQRRESGVARAEVVEDEPDPEGCQRRQVRVDRRAVFVGPDSLE